MWAQVYRDPFQDKSSTSLGKMGVEDNCELGRGLGSLSPRDSLGNPCHHTPYSTWPFPHSSTGCSGRGAGFRCHRDYWKPLNHNCSDATDLLSASMFVKSPAEFIPIQDESSNFGHVAGKHCLHAWNKETRAKKKKKNGMQRGFYRSGGSKTSWHTYFLPLTAL